MDYTPTCPYVTDVEVQAWGEGLTFGLHGNEYLERNEANPYTSGDTCVAWAQGYDDGKYKPAPFNPMEVEAGRLINVYIYHDVDTSVSPGVVRGTYLSYAWVGGTLEGKPEWADNRWEHRSIEMDKYQLQYIIKRGVHDGRIMDKASIELPCPPYLFEYESGGMSMSAGAFTKYGDKDDFQAVITSMQEALDAAPEAIDIEDLSLTVDMSVQATYTVEVSAYSLLGEETFEGDADQLYNALEDALTQMDTYELEPDAYSHVEYDTTYGESEFAHLSGDIDSVT